MDVALLGWWWCNGRTAALLHWWQGRMTEVMAVQLHCWALLILLPPPSPLCNSIEANPCSDHSHS